jgi:hypothetical protein
MTSTQTPADYFGSGLDGDFLEDDFGDLRVGTVSERIAVLEKLRPGQFVSAGAERVEFGGEERLKGTVRLLAEHGLRIDGRLAEYRSEIVTPENAPYMKELRIIRI